MPRPRASTRPEKHQSVGACGAIRDADPGVPGRFASNPGHSARPASMRGTGSPSANLVPYGEARKLQPPATMTDYHESPEELDARARDFHRALTSLKEEIEAVDWYGQRVHCAANAELQRVLEHNRKEEIEHACMTLEWLRREAPEWDAALRTYLFQQGDIVSIEDRAEAEEEGGKGKVESSKSSKDGQSSKGSQGRGSMNKAGTTAETGRGLGVGSLREVGR